MNDESNVILERGFVRIPFATASQIKMYLEFHKKYLLEQTDTKPDEFAIRRLNYYIDCLTTPSIESLKTMD
ncbi:hypothetical protein [Acinetobacter sp. ANC 5045]|uniref:hypothetical protein n=1 Tax=Acinetobacter sp. ANC 5045 TaxID=2529851 RepID=UPI00103BA52C|nr:hypothetical protein [Acinetobacter sp. ANC 5045]TCB14919.1 hypothetical protein E0H79_11990 [Acinetobacter sp. ANC 5045]